MPSGRVSLLAPLASLLRSGRMPLTRRLCASSTFQPGLDPLVDRVVGVDGAQRHALRVVQGEQLVVNPGAIKHQVPGQRTRLPARAQFQRDGVLGFEGVEHLAAVRAFLHADGLVERHRLEAAAQVQVNQRLVVPLVSHAALRIERAELIVVGLIAQRRGTVAVTENAVDVHGLETREQGEPSGQIELVLREQGQVEVVGPVREEERADLPVWGWRKRSRTPARRSGAPRR